MSPVSVTASSTDPSPYFTAPNLINHSGLLTDFFSGISDFDSYIAGNPQHSENGKFAEWFSEQGQTSAILTFDMGSVMLLDRLALWNEEFSGVGSVDVALSSDGAAYTDMGGFSPTDWPFYFASYGADIFAFTATPARFVQLSLGFCPQRTESLTLAADGACGLGEVAFRQAAAVPEPLTLSVFGIGAGLLMLLWRKQKQVALPLAI